MSFGKEWERRIKQESYFTRLCAYGLGWSSSNSRGLSRLYFLSHTWILSMKAKFKPRLFKMESLNSFLRERDSTQLFDLQWI